MYEILKPVTVDGLAYVEGQIVDGAALPAGSIESLLTGRYARRIESPTETPAEPEAVPQPAETPTTVPKRSRSR